MNRIALYHLETLIWIARLGTFAAAAERLNASQPTISVRMRELESQIGAKIFQRHGRNMALTIRGRELVKQAEALWANAEEFLLAPSAFALATGVVRIGSGEIAAATYLPTFVAELDRAFPTLNLEVEIDLTARLIDHLLDGSLDLAFTLGPIVIPGVRTVTIGEIDLIWLASPSVVEKIAKQAPTSDQPPTIWSLPRTSPMHSAMTAAIQDLHLPEKSINLCNNIRSMIEIVERGVGVGLFPINMVVKKMASGALVRVFKQSPPAIPVQVSVRAGALDPILEQVFKRIAVVS